MHKVLPLLTLAVLTSGVGYGQDTLRYLDPIFDVTGPTSGAYATNISVLTGEPEPDTLVYDLYQPEADSTDSRAVAVVMSSGTFLPFITNTDFTGTIRDSVVVETATRLAARGYVVFVPEYRQGWNPSSSVEEVRTGTLLNAAYRGGIDLRTFMRFLRKSVAEDQNPFAIDTSAMMMIGYGTGAYNLYTANFLDDYEEVVQSKFLDSTNTPYVTLERDGNPYGTVQAPLNLPNYPEYSSSFDFGVAIGGAMGDSTWIDGTDDEAPIIALHGPNNTSAPFENGAVNVFTGFVIDVSGPRYVIERANELGVNDPLGEINGILAAEEDFATLRAASLENFTVTTPDGIVTTAATENLFPFIGPDLGEGFYAPYNWIDSVGFEQTVAFYNTQVPEAFQRNATEIIEEDKLYNPNTTNPAGAKAYIDTIMQFVLPRAYAVLELGTLDVFVDVIDIQPAEVGFRLYPNPVVDRAVIEVEAEVELQLLAIYDNAGRRVAATRMSGSKFTLDRGNLPAGIYTMYVQTSKGALATQLVAR